MKYPSKYHIFFTNFFSQQENNKFALKSNRFLTITSAQDILTLELFR